LHTGVPIDLQPDDLVFTFYGPLLPAGWRGDVLTVPVVDTRIFTSAGVDPADRHGTAVWIHRHLDKGGRLHPLTADSTEISFRVPERDAHELAALLRQVECLYLYEHSALTFEALMCGCPVVFIPNEIEALPRDPEFMDGHGIAWTPDPADVARAKATVHLATERYRRLEREFWTDLNRFVVTTQASARARQP
jgi:hypothetical protein